MKRFGFLFLLLSVLLLGGCSDDDTLSNRSPATTASPAASAQNLVRGQVTINFSGAPQQRANVTMAFGVEPGSNAWLAIQNAIGTQNLSFQDFGGSLGIFITGFYGVAAEGNSYWEFRVNGASSNVGVSTYMVQNSDAIEFRYSR